MGVTMMNNINASGVSGAASAEAKVQVQAPVQQTKSEADVKKNIKADDLSNSSDGIADPKELEKTVNDLNQKLANEELSVAFSMDKDSGHFVVKIHDRMTGELVRQIPSKETLQFAQNVEKGIGIIVDSEY